MSGTYFRKVTLETRFQVILNTESLKPWTSEQIGKLGSEGECRCVPTPSQASNLEKHKSLAEQSVTKEAEPDPRTQLSLRFVPEQVPGYG